MDNDGPEASPARAVVIELHTLREEFRSALLAYSVRIEQQLAAVETAVDSLSKQRRIPPARLRDLRDMLGLLRKFSIKPEKGRRKDLKKIDDLVDDLSMLAENWGTENP